MTQTSGGNTSIIASTHKPHSQVYIIFIVPLTRALPIRRQFS